jgi:hypothetical protein
MMDIWLSMHASLRSGSVVFRSLPMHGWQAAMGPETAGEVWPSCYFGLWYVGGDYQGNGFNWHIFDRGKALIVPAEI